MNDLFEKDVKNKNVEIETSDVQSKLPNKSGSIYVTNLPC